MNNPVSLLLEAEAAKRKLAPLPDVGTVPPEAVPLESSRCRLLSAVVRDVMIAPNGARIDSEEAVRQRPTALDWTPKLLFEIWLCLLTGQSRRQKQHCSKSSNQQRSSRACFGDARNRANV